MTHIPGTIEPTPGGQLAEQVAGMTADAATQAAQRAHELHQAGNDNAAATTQEWGAMDVGVAPVDPATGKKLSLGRPAVLVTQPENGNTGFAQVDPKAAMDVLHGRAQVEDAQRAEVPAPAATPTGFMGRIAARFRTGK